MAVRLPIGPLVSSTSMCFVDPISCDTLHVMRREFAATVWQEGDWYVSQCLEVDVASQGETEDEALRNLQEALALHFEPP